MVWLRPGEGLDTDSTAAVDNVAMPTGTPQAGNDLQVVGWRVAEVRTEWSLIENTCFGITIIVLISGGHFCGVRQAAIRDRGRPPGK